MRRATVDVEALSGMGTAEFSTAVESGMPLIVDRTLRGRRRGATVRTPRRAVAAPALHWYLAEGATHSGFDLFYCCKIRMRRPRQVRVRYLRPAGPDREDLQRCRRTRARTSGSTARSSPARQVALANTDVSAVLDILNNQPIIVERAMYSDVPGQFFGAGHESAGVTAPALEWFLAEGATGPTSICSS